MEPLSKDISEEIEKKKTYIQSMYPFYGYGIYSILLKEKNQENLENPKKLIGLAGFSNGDEGLELGYILHRNFRGKGYAREACEELIRFAREILYAEEIYCKIDKNNTKSRILCESLGFRLDSVDTNKKIVYKKEL